MTAPNLSAGDIRLNAYKPPKLGPINGVESHTSWCTSVTERWVARAVRTGDKPIKDLSHPSRRNYIAELFKNVIADTDTIS